MNSKTAVYHKIINSRIGKLSIAATKKGVCCIQIGADERALKSDLKKRFSGCAFLKSDLRLNQWTQQLSNYLSGKASWPRLPYEVDASPFQKKVWDCLRKIPSGQTFSYADVAKAIGAPRAARAVARACASNPVALVVPCHRIVPKSGGVGGYYWHPKRKKLLLELEKRLTAC